MKDGLLSFCTVVSRDSVVHRTHREQKKNGKKNDRNPEEMEEESHGGWYDETVAIMDLVVKVRWKGKESWEWSRAPGSKLWGARGELVKMLSCLK